MISRLKGALYTLSGIAIGAAGTATLHAQSATLPAYLVALIDVHDMNKYKTEYAPNVTATLAPYGGHYVVAGGRTEPVEGEPPPNRVVIIQFPDMDHAKAWYNSAEYGKIRPIRQAVSTTRSLIVEGRPPAQ